MTMHSIFKKALLCCAISALVLSEGALAQTPPGGAGPGGNTEMGGGGNSPCSFLISTVLDYSGNGSGYVSMINGPCFRSCTQSPDGLCIVVDSSSSPVICSNVPLPGSTKALNYFAN